MATKRSTKKTTKKTIAKVKTRGLKIKSNVRAGCPTFIVDRH